MSSVGRFLNFTREHSTEDSLDYALTWNMSMLQTPDMMTAAMALMSRQTPAFPDLPDLPRLDQTSRL